MKKKKYEKPEIIEVNKYPKCRCNGISTIHGMKGKVKYEKNTRDN